MNQAILTKFNIKSTCVADNNFVDIPGMDVINKLLFIVLLELFLREVCIDRAFENS